MGAIVGVFVGVFVVGATVGLRVSPAWLGALVIAFGVWALVGTFVGCCVGKAGTAQDMIKFL